jgi:hypothetical protein
MTRIFGIADWTLFSGNLSFTKVADRHIAPHRLGRSTYRFLRRKEPAQAHRAPAKIRGLA